jgi:hypothetical protein
MSSAKVIIKEQDRSSIVPSFPGLYGGIALRAKQGPVGVPFLVTGENELINVFGEPMVSSTGFYSAMAYLGESNKLWVVRAAHEDCRYSGALVRSKVNSIPTSIPLGTFVADPIVKPLVDGLTEDGLASFQFPVYATNRIYKELSNTIFESSNGKTIRVNSLTGITVGDSLVFSAGTINDLDNDDVYYEVQSTETVTLTMDKATVSDAISGTSGTEIFKVVDGNLVEYANHPTVVRDFSNSKSVLVDNADYIGQGDIISIGGAQTTFSKKSVYNEEAAMVTVDNDVSVDNSLKIFVIAQSEFEDRDAFLVVSANQGNWGNKLSIAITPNKDYSDIGGFNLLVYFDGVLVETWVVSRQQVLDGYGKSLFLEDKINGKSSYIKVLDNPGDRDFETDIPEMPLDTDFSLWIQDPEDLFQEQTIVLAENLLRGHTEVKLSGTNGLEIGTRVKFAIDEGKLSAEYKLLSVDSVANTAILDRQIVEEEILKDYMNSTGGSVAAQLFKFDATINDAANGIKDGIQYFKVSKIDKTLYNYPLNSVFIISGVRGTLVDAGANMPLGGFDGSAITVSDMVIAIKKLENKENTPVTLVMDGGFTHPAYAQAIHDVCKSQNLTHGYISCDPQAELSANYKSAIVDYKASTMLNTEKCSFFTGWVKVLDTYNQKEVWVAPDGFAAASQSFTTRNFQMFYPAGGWTRGKFDALDVQVKFSEGDRDWFVDNQINPIRYKKGSGLVIWGNETMLVKPSPMQLRSVAMLLIMIKYSVDAMLEYKTFELNNEDTWSAVEGAINGYMRDEIQAKGGVYSFQVSVKDVITDSDIDNRTMPVFIGIQPTSDIKLIPVTLAIYNKSADISVSL